MSQKAKILYFCSSSIFGGAERFIETCLKEHRLQQDDVHVFFLNTGYFSERLINEGYSVFTSKSRVKLSNPISWLRFQIELYKLIKKHKFTHVHATMAYSQIFCSIAAWLSQSKLIWFQHGPIGGLIDRVANLLPYDHIIFNSSYTQSEHRLKAGKIKSSSTILTLAVNPSHNKEESHAIKSKYSGELFVTMGRICRWKGYESAIIALSKYEREFTLLIIGKPSTEDDYAYFEELNSLVNNLKLSNNIQFLGFKDNVYDYLAAADALIHSSKIPEPFGLVVAEAKALGIYVYATKIGGIIDQLNNNYCGMMYSASNPSEDLLRLLRQGGHINFYSNNSTLSSVKDMVMRLNNIYAEAFSSKN